METAENAYEADVEVVSPIKKLGDRYSVSILLVHHLKRGRERERLVGVFVGFNGLGGDRRWVIKSLSRPWSQARHSQTNRAKL